MENPRLGHGIIGRHNGRVFFHAANISQGGTDLAGTASRCIVTVLAVLWLFMGCPADVFAAGQRESLVPWSVVGREFKSVDPSRAAGPSGQDAKIVVSARTTGRAGNVGNHAFRPDQPVVVGLPSETLARRSALGKTRVGLAEWRGSSWKPVREFYAQAERNHLKTDSGVGKEGFFRLDFVWKTEEGKSANVVAYVIVAKKWKSDLLTYCRLNREQIEMGPDPERICSSIAVSHWDHTMQLVAKAGVLSEPVLAALANAVRARRDFDIGGRPDLVTGLNKLRLVRFAGAPTEEFVVLVPDEYVPEKAWPVYLHPDNRRYAARMRYRERSGLIDIWWHTVADEEIDWKSYWLLMDLLKEKLNIDEDRIYVNGECRDGMAATSLALTRPDHWAECSVSLTSTHRHLAGNALNLDMIYVKGGHDDDWEIGYYDFAIKCFEYFGCENLVQSKTEKTVQVRGNRVPQAIRVKKPQRVFYSLDSLKSPQAYWARIDGREDENFVGRLDARVRGQTIDIVTTNVDAYTLNLAEAPINLAQSIEITENGKHPSYADGRVITRRSDKYDGAMLVKDEHVHGPVWEVFTDAYAIITGMDVNPQARQSCEVLAGHWGKGAPRLLDVEAPEALVGTHNIIIVGDPKAGSWPSKLREGLPLEITKDRVSVVGRPFQGHDIGVILVYPNPLNAKRYVAVFTGNSVKAMIVLQKAYDQLKSMRPADIGIFDVTRDGGIHWRVFEKLSTVWTWHAPWDQTLLDVRREHPRWQWRQWVMRVLRKHLKADVVLCEDPFRFDDGVPVGQVTYRDLANTFINHWLVKIELNGGQLRQLMLPFDSMPSRSLDTPTVAGIRFQARASDREDTSLQVDGLETNRQYSLVCNHKCLNGTRLGQSLQDYKLVDQVHLVPALRAYLLREGGGDIDTELDRLPAAIH